MRHQQAEPPPLARQSSELLVEVETIVRKMLAKKPTDRYQTPGEVARALAQFDTAATIRLPAPTATELGRRRRHWFAPLAGAAVLLLGGTLLWWALSASARKDGRMSGQMALAATSGASVSQSASASKAPPSSHPGPVAVTRVVIRGRDMVRDALVDFGQPDKRFGVELKDNAVRRGEECNAFLVRFDLSRVAIAPQMLKKATLSFFVWDPSSKGVTKVCAFGVLTPWDEATVTWKQPVEGKPWKGGKNFVFGVDTGPPSPYVVVQPDQPGTDTVDPPLEYQLDVTPLVRSWLAGGEPNHGLAIAPVIDRSIDDGYHSRFQIYGSKHGRAQYTPTLTLQTQP